MQAKSKIISLIFSNFILVINVIIFYIGCINKRQTISIIVNYFWSIKKSIVDDIYSIQNLSLKFNIILQYF